VSSDLDASDEAPALARVGDRFAIAWSAAAGAGDRLALATLDPETLAASEPLVVAEAERIHNVILAPRAGGAWLSWLEGPPAGTARVQDLRCDP
jgi:hypothetical protein